MEKNISRHFSYLHTHTHSVYSNYL